MNLFIVNLSTCIITGIVLIIATIYDLKHNFNINGQRKFIWVIIFFILIMSITMEIIRYGFGYIMLLHLFYIYVLIILSVYDIKEKLLPVKWLIIGFVLGILCLHINTNISYFEGFLTAGISILLISILSKSTRGGIGFGDGIVIALIGLLLGWELTFSVFILALLFSSVGGIVLLIMNKVHRKTMLPFVPFILAATCFVLWI